jgi:two-component system chemotaxis family response regulator WspR
MRLLLTLAGPIVGVAYLLHVRWLKRSERNLTELLEHRTAELLERTAQLEVANSALEVMATVDPVTGLANRRRFDVFFQQEWQRSRRSQQPLSLLMIDIDHFKAFNDRYGHQRGDECIQAVAGVLRAAAHRPADLACRYGGEEFSVVLAETGATGAFSVAETIRRAVEALQIQNPDAPLGLITVSIGAGTRSGEEYGRAAELITACDRALYEAKNSGRNRTCPAVAVEA